jgi:uncharacterized SAM-binding protein YcdF (DUF218 family)
VLADAVNNLISIFGIFCALGVGAWFLWRWPKSAWPRRFVIAVIVVYGVIAIPIVPYAASRLFGAAYQPYVTSSREPPPSAIVLLGAGTQIVAGPEQQMALLDAVGAGRVLEAARVYRQLGQPWIISSGGTKRPNPQVSSAVAMQTALIQLGVEASRIVLEAKSLTTNDEATLIAPVLRSLGAQRFVLVTHRTHMRRSLAVFARQGLQPIAAIVPDGLQDADWSDLLTPGPEGLRLSHALFHEVIGLGYYRLRGWTSG